MSQNLSTPIQGVSAGSKGATVIKQLVTKH